MADMSFDDLWAHQFCLTCDKQVQIDGAAYCSEACRLAEAEKPSASCSQASSPGFSSPSAYPWTASVNAPSQPRGNRSSLTSTYDFAAAQPYGTTPAPRSYFSQSYNMASTNKPARSLTPSSSQASLCSMQSQSSLTDANQISDKARRELQAYANTFEQVRAGRRRSY